MLEFDALPSGISLSPSNTWKPAACVGCVASALGKLLGDLSGN